MAWCCWQQAKQVDPSLCALDDFFTQPPVKAQSIAGGLTNRCWQLECTQGVKYVWRPSSIVCDAFAISRYVEYQVLNAIAPLQLGPKPLFVHPQGLLVEWVEGVALTDTGIELEPLLQTAAAIHRFPISAHAIESFSYLSRIDHYWRGLTDKYINTDFEVQYRKWRTEPNVTPVPSALCHFDLGCYNLVQSAAGVKVIDWEYAGLADPRLDLALILPLAGVPIELGVTRYCHMRHIEDVPSWIEGVRAWIPRTQVMAMLWYLLAYQIYNDEQYLNSAHEFLRLLT